jgi:RNA polymerase-binding protein DksA
MDGRTVLKYRRRLLDELGQRGRLLGKMKKSIAEQGARYMDEGNAFANHMAEAATGEAERESEYALADVEGKLVQEIEEAIERIDHGGFGECEWCGADIDKRRLDVLPYARFCLKCQEKAERISRN